mmetsp:Transcript_4442/g.6704  ORF Transcript_4442/g.6704 Transcript_4442/m.6704 type:complete len:154 (+) Transcript_4442:26-487(+)
MSTRGLWESEPSYSENNFKFWYTNYKDSKFRQGMVRREHFDHPEVDSHDFSHETKAPSQFRKHARLYKQPYDVPYPRECSKQISKLAFCKHNYNVYSPADDVPQCNHWKNLIFEDCPHWVLENLALKKRFAKRAESIDNLTYRRAMEVSDYNK